MLDMKSEANIKNMDLHGVNVSHKHRRADFKEGRRGLSWMSSLDCLPAETFAGVNRLT